MTIPKLVEPIFLMCSERSGSNLISKMFDAHPHVAAPGTSHLFRVFSNIAWTYKRNDPELKRDILAMFEAKVGAWLIDDLPADRISSLIAGTSSAAGMIAALMNAECEAAGKSVFFVKENFIYDFLPFLESVSVRPRYVHMVRDPRSMAASWQKAAVLRGGIVRAARRWNRDQEGFLKALSWLDGIRPIAHLTYEELIAEPESTLRRVCGDLELPYSEEMLEFSTRSRSAQSDAARASVWSNISRPIMKGNDKKYLRDLSQDQLAFVDAVCGPIMEKLGYHASAGEAIGSFDGIEALTAHLEAEEPWDKPEYNNLPHVERARFEAWSTLYDRLKGRSG